MSAESVVEGALDLALLEKYLRSAGVDVVGDLSARLLSGGKSNLTFAVADAEHRWVLRRPPVGEILPGAHNMGREYRVMQALGGTSVPVPRAVALCDSPEPLGAPFYVMEELGGRVIRTQADASDLGVATRRELGLNLVDILADLHDLDYEAVGLGDLGRPVGYLSRQLARWTTQLGKVQTRAFPHAGVITEVLGRTLPATSAASLVHGDYRLDNVIVDADDAARVEAVLDWEMATLGDPLADLGTLLMFWDEPGERFNPITSGLMALEGFPARDEVIDRYLARRALPLDDLDWYLVFSEFKLAVILEQINARHQRGETLGDGFDGLPDMVAGLFESARDRIGRSPALRSS